LVYLFYNQLAGQLIRILYEEKNTHLRLFSHAFICLLASIESTPTAFPPDHLPTAVALTGQAAFATADALTQIAPQL